MCVCVGQCVSGVYLLIRVRLRFSITKCHKYTNEQAGILHTEHYTMVVTFSFFAQHAAGLILGNAVMTREGSLCVPASI